MKIPDEIKTVLKRLIESGNLLHPLPKEIANREDVLPLYPSGLGWYGINLEGEIVGTDGTKPYEIKQEEDSLLIHVALFQGIKRYPELSPLSPVRAENDLTCPYCGGSGQHPLAGKISILCYCGDSGWIPRPKDQDGIGQP